jgi:chaperonin cofactor prefoldin
VQEVLIHSRLLKQSEDWYSCNIQEFAQLKPDNTVYKLFGPVLIQQDQTEARSNVDNRIQLIQGEMWASLFDN